MTKNQPNVNETLIAGTLRTEDLLSKFAEEIERLGGEHSVPESALCNFGDRYWESEDAAHELEEAYDTLNEFAPEGFYFGSHPGDGSDFGFWSVEE